MSWFSLVSGIFEPAAKLVDALHTSEEEKLKFKQTMFELQTAAMAKAQEYESKLLEAKASIINSEANSSSWLAKNWRPITMLTFLVLVVCDSFGWLVTPLAKEAWTLLQIGLGGYVVGRSVEKTVATIKKE